MLLIRYDEDEQSGIVVGMEAGMENGFMGLIDQVLIQYRIE